jgi:hypothetical protein
MTEVVETDDGYWAVYQGDYLVFLGDFDTAMMVGREVDEQWEPSNATENEQRELDPEAPAPYEPIEEL